MSDHNETRDNMSETARCWRSECRNACYYPDACGERAPVSGDQFRGEPGWRDEWGTQ